MTPEEEEALVRRLGFSEKRLDDFMGLLEQQSTDRETRMGFEEEQSARFWALYQIVIELAEREGVTRDDFGAHFMLRYRLLHDQALARSRQIDAGYAARIDRRTLEEVPTYESCPSIFDPPQA